MRTKLTFILLLALFPTVYIVLKHGETIIYIIKLAHAEASILIHRVDLEDALKDTHKLTPVQRERLKLVCVIRKFAADKLGLEVGKKYSQVTFAESQKIFSVTAAYPDRLEPYLWWFPIVGNVPYKGYFSSKDSLEEAKRLKTLGLDTSVGKVGGFSTLGWFNDPILLSMLEKNEYTLTETIIHEISHGTLYVKGQSNFNESLATFVGTEGAFLFFESRYGKDSPEYVQARNKKLDQEIYSDFINRMCGELETLFSKEITREEKIKNREIIYKKYQANYEKLPLLTSSFDYFPGLKLNNAIVLSLRRYKRDLKLFQEVFLLHGKDMRETMEFLKTLAGKEADIFELMKKWIKENEKSGIHR